MITRVIFDIDNTLIPWKDEYWIEVDNVLNSLNIKHSEEDNKAIKKAFAEYENLYYTFNKQLLINFINKYTNKNYPIELVTKLLENWSNCVPKELSQETIKTLQYLKPKYDMVILTDWFADQQLKRLEKTNISGYFSKLYAAEKTKRKPFKEAFLQAIGNNKSEECIMIGDNFERDIEGALNAGLGAIYYNPTSKQVNENQFIGIKDNKKYYEIKKLEEIIKIL